MRYWLDQNIEILSKFFVYSTMIILLFVLMNSNASLSMINGKDLILLGWVFLSLISIWFIASWWTVIIAFSLYSIFYLIDPIVNGYIDSVKDILLWLFNSQMVIVSCH